MSTAFTATKPSQHLVKLSTSTEKIMYFHNKPLIQHMGNRAYYNPLSDTVTLPPQIAFQSPEKYYATCFHELTHSTMHEDRLNRKVTAQVHSWGDEAYSKEELVAEMGASFLCGHTGIENMTIENSAAYLAGWLKALKNDRTLLIHAAAQAQKASDYIMGNKLGEEGNCAE
jgi:antirestriction protein ArdC